MAGYVFGGATGITPEELARRRRSAEALIQNGIESEPRNIWDGLGSIAQALSGSLAYNRIAAREKEGLAGAEAAFRPIATAFANSTKPSSDELNAALSNPWMNDGQKLLIQSMFKAQGTK